MTVLSNTPHTAQRKDFLMRLQQTYGNTYVQRLMDSISVRQSASTVTIQRQFEEEGRTEANTEEGVPVAKEEEQVNPIDDRFNEWGEKEGYLTSDETSHAFIDGGKTGASIFLAVGGRGGTGNQKTGSINLVAPRYESRGPSSSGGSAKAWIVPGTGTAQVTRSYTGCIVGTNGPNLYLTQRAVNRIDQHEEMHVIFSRSIHDRYIMPLEVRIARYTMEANALSSGSSAEEAETALRNFIDWNAAVNAFQLDDIAANRNMGSVDQIELALPNCVRSYGPRQVNGVNYANYWDTQPGPGPSPTAPP
jgi:hypothetical protein